MSALGECETEPREALAAAIRRHSAANDRLARINDAAEKISLWAATEAVEEAEATLKQLRAKEPKRLVARLLGDAVPPGPGVAEAEQSLAEVKTALELAQRTRDALDGQRTAAESELSWAKSALNAAVAAVVQAEGDVAKLWAQFEDARREVARLREMIGFLSSRNCLPATAASWDAVRFYPPTGAEGPWRAALTALESDAEAALPD